MNPCGSECGVSPTFNPDSFISQPEYAEESSETFFNVLLPVILVVGALFTIGFGLLFHRLILKLLRKRWASESVSPVNMEGNSYSRRGVNTVSQLISEPPTYVQFIKTIEKEETPPSYYEINLSVTNCGFTSDDGTFDFVSTSQQGERIDQDISTMDTNSDLPPYSVFISQDNNNLASDSNQNVDRTKTVDRVKEDLPAKSYLATTSHIDDIIDSIAVPSIVYEAETDSSANIPGCKKLSRCGRVIRVHGSKRKPSSNRCRSSSFFLRSTQL